MQKQSQTKSMLPLFIGAGTGESLSGARLMRDGSGMGISHFVNLGSELAVGHAVNLQPLRYLR